MPMYYLVELLFTTIFSKKNTSKLSWLENYTSHTPQRCNLLLFSDNGNTLWLSGLAQTGRKCTIVAIVLPHLIPKPPSMYGYKSIPASSTLTIKL